MKFERLVLVFQCLHLTSLVPLLDCIQHQLMVFSGEGINMMVFSILKLSFIRETQDGWGMVARFFEHLDCNGRSVHVSANHCKGLQQVLQHSYCYLVVSSNLLLYTFGIFISMHRYILLLFN